MLEDILSLERDLFLSLNSWQSPLLDNAIWLYSNWLVWLPLLAIFFCFFIYGKPAKVWLPVIVSFILLILACVLVSELLLKPHFARFRPTYHPDFMNDVKYLFDYKGEGLYGFVSGHATFSFAFATFTTLLFRYRPYGITIFVWAVIMVYSRIYLGVHFLTDILAGAVVGAVVGLGIFCLYKWIVRKYIYPKDKGAYLSPYSGERMRLITITLICYILLFTVFSKQIVWLTM